MAKLRYSWTLTKPASSGPDIVHIAKPLYDDKLAKQIKQEQNEVFFRHKISAKLKFIAQDFHFIMTTGFEKKIKVFLRYETQGVIVNQYWVGYFYITDCKNINHKDAILEVTPRTEDNYDDILNALNKTFSVSELALKTTALSMNRPPILQAYALGDSTLTNIVGGTYWETKTNKIISDATTLISDHHFSLSFEQYYMIVADNVGIDVSGLYFATSTPIGFNTSFLHENGVSKVVMYSYSELDTGAAHDKTSDDLGSIWSSSGNHWILIKISSSTKLIFLHTFYGYHIDSDLTHISGALHNGSIHYDSSVDHDRRYIIDLSNSSERTHEGLEWPAVDLLATNFKSLSGSYHIAHMQKDAIYTRYITGRDFFSTWPTIELPDEDLIDNNRNYDRCLPYSMPNFIYSSEKQIEPTELGEVPEQCVSEVMYYKEFIHTTEGRGIPVGHSLWGCNSVWFYYTDAIRGLELGQPDLFTLRHSYSISSIISAIFEKLDLPFTYLEDLDHSEFFNSPTNPISSNAFKVLIAPKSNVAIGEYDKPATAAKISLGSILDMLYKTFRVKWKLNGTKLVLEHISWFLNGETYTPGVVIGLDLTSLRQVKGHLPWGNVEKWQFSKIDMPERFEFSWMDRASKAFEGFPIIMRSNYVSKGNIKKENVANFSSDLTLMLASPARTDEDGFALIAAVFNATENRYETSFEEFTIDNNKYYVQNGLVSWPFLHQDYHAYNLPTRLVNINNEDLDLANNLSLHKEQNVAIPMLLDVNPMELVKTSIGFGRIKEISIILHSRMAQIKLAHETE